MATNNLKVGAMELIKTPMHRIYAIHPVKFPYTDGPRISVEGYFIRIVVTNMFVANKVEVVREQTIDRPIANWRLLVFAITKFLLILGTAIAREIITASKRSMDMVGTKMDITIKSPRISCKRIIR
ncbi:hypothetical protein ACS0TY_035023 [Phlomoides rotata]